MSYMSMKPKILEELERITQFIPAPIYWEDVNSIILGANDLVFKASGTLKREAYVGKSLYELYPKEMADHIKQHNELVMLTQQVLSQEESIRDVSTGKIKYFTAIKAPLRDKEGIVIGIVGTSIDITAQKEAERLALENEAHKAQLQEQEKFSKVVNQVAHDIRSPLSALLMTVKSCRDIPEPQRIALREAAISITDITNNLLQQYKFKEVDSPNKIEGPEPILCSAALLQLLTEKKYQYQELPVKFDHDFTQIGHFAFINIEESPFKRMVSNLINNAVDAFEDQEGRVTVCLEADEDSVKLIIDDDGKGMPPEVINKILNKISVTAGKKDGNGLGMTQVNDTLERFQGEIAIHSLMGKGTQVTVNFPRIDAPTWIAEKIELSPDDIVIILDDDTSIHTAWDTHFESLLRSQPGIQLRHFEQGQETVDFLNGLHPEQKSKVLLLTDYELLKQKLNGLDVVGQTGIKNSILVTSHYANQAVRAQAIKTGTKILPKQMASEVPIIITVHDDADEDVKLIDQPVSGRTVNTRIEEEPAIYTINETEIDFVLRKVDLVLIEDDRGFASTVETYLRELKNSVLDCYYNPHDFLKVAHQYPKNTKISLDNDFHLKDIDGLKLAKILYDLGYTNLFLLSGKDFSEEEVPPYLTFIIKTDLERMLELL
jgi:PAS domain S-box-containing protein